MTTTLTDRYIAAVVRTLPASAQEDVRAELQASIADDVEARIAGGEAEVEAEHAVISALGDPDALAAGYADRPLHLIGPKCYLTWWRLLKLLWAIVPAVAVVGVVIGKTLADDPVGDIVAAAISVGLATVVHIAFWTTLVFVVLERTGADTGVRWTPEHLPEPQETGAGRGELVSSLVLLGIAAALLLWDRFVGVVFFATGDVDVSQGLGGQTTHIPVLHPDLWPWWAGALLVVIALEAALAVAVYVRRGWTPALATLNTVLAVVVAVPAVWLLATGQLINPALVEFALSGGDLSADVPRILAIITGAAIIGVAAWDIVDGWRKARRRR